MKLQISKVYPEVKDGLTSVDQNYSKTVVVKCFQGEYKFMRFWLGVLSLLMKCIESSKEVFMYSKEPLHPSHGSNGVVAQLLQQPSSRQLLAHQWDWGDNWKGKS